jgi:hypothetical protein
MHSTVTRPISRAATVPRWGHGLARLAVAACAAITLACGGTDHGDSDVNPPPTTTPGEAVGTSGTNDQRITISGCITKASPDGYMLTSRDEAVLRETTGTAGHHRDNADTTPTEANRGAEDERLRHAQNPSAELGRYRLEGDGDRIAMFVNREVDVEGRVSRDQADNSLPATLSVEKIDASGPSCGKR